MAHSVQDIKGHLVSLSRFDKSISRVMDKTHQLLKREQAKYSFPTLIGIDVVYNGHPESFPMMRAFLEKLRSVHQNNFVRFVTDTLWAMETNNGDIFYTHDGSKDQWSDIVWEIKLVGPEQVEISLKPVVNHCRQKFLQDLSSHLRRFITTQMTPMSEDSIRRLITNFCHKSKLAKIISNIDEPLHIMLIPNLRKTGYYPVALYGMNHFDAKRRYRRMVGELRNAYHQHYETLPGSVSAEDIFYNILSLVQANGRFGLEIKSEQDTYNLAEMLFALCADNTDFDQSPHDVILFQPGDEFVKTVNFYSYCMRDLTND